MGGSQNICALLVGVAAFAHWTIFRFSSTQRITWVHWLGGVGALALFLSIASPDDDAFQQELIRPKPASATVSSHTRIAQRGSPADFSIKVVAAALNPALPLRTGRLFVADQPFDRLTHFQAPTSIHSPPIAS